MTSLDFPTPAAPRTVKRWHARSSTARRYACSRAASSRAAPDHRRVEPAGATRRIPGQSHESVSGDLLALALEAQRLEGFDLDRVSHEPVRRVAEEDLARGRGLLEPLGDVDGVAGCESLAPSGVAGNHLARVDAGPHLDPDTPVPLEVVVQAGELFTHLGRGADRAERVVFVDDRNPEDGHHRVSDELLDDALVRSRRPPASRRNSGP